MLAELQCRVSASDRLTQPAWNAEWSIPHDPAHVKVLGFTACRTMERCPSPRRAHQRGEVSGRTQDPLGDTALALHAGFALLRFHELVGLEEGVASLGRQLQEHAHHRDVHVVHVCGVRNERQGQLHQ